jgi:hypothetical protein
MKLTILAGSAATDLELFDTVALVRRGSLAFLVADCSAHEHKAVPAFFRREDDETPDPAEEAWGAVRQALKEEQATVDLSEWAVDPTEADLEAAGLCEPMDEEGSEPEPGDGSAEPIEGDGRRVILRLGVGDASKDELAEAIGRRVTDVQRSADRVAVICE